MLRQALLDVLCCPRCKGDLDYRHDPELLVCRKCGARYPVKNDIPIMLVEEPARRD